MHCPLNVKNVRITFMFALKYWLCKHPVQGFL